MLVHVYRGDSAVKTEKTLFLHGYPGVRSNQNRDVAERLAMSSGRESHVLLYAGLTQAPGVFSFNECLRDVHAYVETLIADPELKRLDVVGHSWGGFLALSLAAKYKKFINHLALMSPLLRFPTLASGSGLREYFTEMARENPALKLGNLDERLSEFLDLGSAYPTDSLIRAIPKTTATLFLQAREDEITPTAIAQEKLANFAGPIEFELVETDHSFLTDRERLGDRLLKFFNE